MDIRGRNIQAGAIGGLVGHVLFGMVLGATYHGFAAQASDTTATV